MTGEIELGSQFAGFRIDGVLGRGGMGVVYLAWHLTLEKPIALKVVVPQLAQDEEFRQRFLREARQAANLDHPNIVPIYHAGDSEGRLFIAMRYVETDLRRVLARDGRLEPARSLSILDQAAGALDAAHQRGLVHRDVKPANILIQPGAGGAGDRAFLTDFGLVKHLDSRTALTRTGMFLGTLEYAAPEQLQARLVDGRTDQYALGCILFECLTGRPPFAAETEAQMMYAHVFEQPPSISARRPDLPPGMDRVISRAMAKDMAARYPSCREVLQEARSLLGGAPAPPPMPIEAQVTVPLALEELPSAPPGAGEIATPPPPVAIGAAPQDAPAPAAALAATVPEGGETAPGPPTPSMQAPPLPETVVLAREARAVAPGAAPLAVLVPLGLAAVLLAIGLFVPIRRGFSPSVHLGSLFFKERLWHALEAAVVPAAAALGALAWWKRPSSRLLVSGVLIGVSLATFLRNLQILVYAGLAGSPGPGAFLRLLGAAALAVGAVIAARSTVRSGVHVGGAPRGDAPGDAPGDATPTAGRAPGERRAPWLWFLGAALVVPAVVLPFARAHFLGRYLSIIGSDDPHRGVYALEPLGVAAAVLAGAVWWWRGRPDRRLLSAVVVGLGAELFLHFLWYALAPVLLHPLTSPSAGGFLGLAASIAIGVGGWRSYRQASRAGPGR
jgi:hypothetical protein